MTGSPRFLTPGNVIAVLAIVVGVGMVLFRSQHLEAIPAPETERASLVLLELQTKLLAGVARFERNHVWAELSKLEAYQGSAAGRRALAAFHAYVSPPESRSGALNRLPSPENRDALDALVARAITEPAALALADRSNLLTRTGWFGRLLLASTDAESSREVDSASLKALTIISLGGLILLLAAGTGMILGVVALARLSQGGLPCRLQPAPERAHLYFQAFAIYLWGMILFSYLVSLTLTSSPSNLAGSACTIMLSVALGGCYPLLRGVSLAQWRSDLGLHWGRGLFREIAAGIAAYLATLPLLAVGLSLTLLLQKLESSSSGEPAGPISHPIYGLIRGASPATLIFLFVLASVLAPLVEEIMFRGAFYGSLRGFLGRTLSLFLMSFIFAAIHPQGIYAIPSLMAIAASFGIMREWRSSLVAGVVTHGLHNGVLLLGVVSLLS